jgi:hypothetical protein
MSASASTSLDASESHSVAVAMDVVSTEMARPSEDWRAASRDAQADVSLATAPAATTQATTSCISSWVRCARSWPTLRARLRPEDSRVYSQQSQNDWRGSRRLQNRKESLTRELTEVAGRMSSSKAWHTQVIPCSRVWRVAASSSPSESVSRPEVTAHKVHASSSV